MNKRLLSVEEAAGYLSISPRTIYNQVSKGTFPIRPKRWGKRVLFDIRDLNDLCDALPNDKGANIAFPSVWQKNLVDNDVSKD